MLTREDVIYKVKTFSNEILLSGFPLEKVILFGSFAKGLQNEDSDIDIALISPSFSGFGFEDRKFFSKINIKKEFSIIEVKTFPSKYFEIGDPFTKEINDTGIILFNKNSDENKDWSDLTSGQFLNGFSENDAIYDNIVN